MPVQAFSVAYSVTVLHTKKNITIEKNSIGYKLCFKISLKLTPKTQR